MTSDDLEHLNKYTETTSEPDRIMVVGVGGGGGNAVNHMYNEAVIHGVSFVVVNTDDMALKCSPVPRKLLIGPTVTRGRGAGNVPERAREAAEESAEDIRALFTDETDMVFITAGMGGGTGTGAAPVVARIARERGLLTIGIVTIPFLFEGMKKIAKAVAGAEEMGKYVDALLVINNERLSEIYPDLAFEESFAKADDTLSIAAQSISEIVTNPGYINLDFNDVDTTLRNGGTAIISIGYGEGENRVSAAIEDALHSPLLKNTDVFSSKKLLFNLSYSRKAEQKFRTDESRELDDFVTKIDSGVDVIWGITYDDTLGEKVKLTILAAGFDVTVRENGKRDDDIIIKGNNPDDPDGAQTIDKEVIKEYYGKEKIDDLQRHNDTRHYILLEADQLDNDEILDTFERTPAYNRNKKSAKVKPAAADDRSRRQAQTDRPAQPKNSRDTDNIIDFSIEE
ncbi:MAG: cell division protein FtsZ [Muribaculaceae bacterium]